jgi:hypothetical protein
MRATSPITWLLNRIALLSAIFTIVSVTNVAAQNRPFLNVSSRAQVLTGDNVMIAGFIIHTTATTTKQILIRGLGPSTGIKFALADPVLTLNGPPGFTPITNNNWRDTQEAAILATGLAPGNNLDSAILVTLPPGQYTAILAGNNGGTGPGLIDVWDMSGPAPIVNLSTRALVGTGNNVLIGGTIIGAPGTRAVIRALGPSLSQFGVQGALQNPILELRDASGALLASNDNWQTNNPDASEISYLGLAPSNANESTILATLAPGSYTAIVKGVSNTTGVGLVELYALPDAKYPRVFQAWGDATNLGGSETIHATRARHDLIWQVDVAFGYNWVGPNGQTTLDYTSEMISQNGPIDFSIPTLRGLNPNIKILVQVAHYDLEDGRLPPEHGWWKRVGGARVHPPFGGPTWLLDNDNPEFRLHVAKRAKALMATGQFDGIMIDTCEAGNYLLPLLTIVRSEIGENGIIIINARHELSSGELAKINGVFMENGKIGSGIYGHPDWQEVKTALIHNETILRSPKVNCLENWFLTSRNNETDWKRMRASTCLSLTLSDGLTLFGDPNDLPSNHLHDWYDFWSGHSLGVPLGIAFNMPGNYASRREFKNGTVVWNAAASTPVTIDFSPQMRRSLKTGAIMSQHTLWGIDGDIYLIP